MSKQVEVTAFCENNDCEVLMIYKVKRKHFTSATLDDLIQQDMYGDGWSKKNEKDICPWCTEKEESSRRTSSVSSGKQERIQKTVDKAKKGRVPDPFFDETFAVPSED